MIVVDIETTGLNPQEHQMVSVGALNLDTGATFYQECRIYPEDRIDPIALKINGFTEEYIRNNSLQSPVELYEYFVVWAGKSKMLGSCNISFDLSFLKKVHYLSGKEYRDFPFRRNIDLYSVYFAKTGDVGSLKHICTKLGIEPEPEIHNALTGAEKAAECFKILLDL